MKYKEEYQYSYLQGFFSIFLYIHIFQCTDYWGSFTRIYVSSRFETLAGFNDKKLYLAGKCACLPARCFMNVKLPPI